MLHPRTTKIQGDLSRQDVIVLHDLCRGKRVVEFGMGGSTLILARCAAILDSYEPFEEWYEKTFHRVQQIPDKTARVQLHKLPVEKTAEGKFQMQTPASMPGCDVMFVDGPRDARGLWLRLYHRSAPLILVHDSRRPVDVRIAMDECLQFLSDLESVEFSFQRSNMLVIRRRSEPLEWEDWNETESGDNRVSVDVRDYVP